MRQDSISCLNREIEYPHRRAAKRYSKWSAPNSGRDRRRRDASRWCSRSAGQRDASAVSVQCGQRSIPSYVLTHDGGIWSWRYGDGKVAGGFAYGQ